MDLNRGTLSTRQHLQQLAARPTGGQEEGQVRPPRLHRRQVQAPLVALMGPRRRLLPHRPPCHHRQVHPQEEAPRTAPDQYTDVLHKALLFFNASSARRRRRPLLVGSPPPP